MSAAPLQALLAGELAQPVAPEVTAFARRLAGMAKGEAAAVLFYGSALRTGATDGVLDFYVLLDQARDWPQGRLAALASGWLPPNVEYIEIERGDRRLRAKVAVMTLAQFEGLCGPAGLDTSVWARFVQPAALVHVRDEDARQAVLAAAAQAVRTAAGWAAALGPDEGEAVAFWRALFRETYATELRIEPKGREAAILTGSEARYARLLPLAWAAEGLGFEDDGGRFHPALSEETRRARRMAWRPRRRWGKPLTVLRLMKAVFTFAGAADYAAWKIERHTGVRIKVTPFIRRHPILASPGVAITLWRRKVWG